MALMTWVYHSHLVAVNRLEKMPLAEGNIDSRPFDISGAYIVVVQIALPHFASVCPSVLETRYH